MSNVSEVKYDQVKKARKSGYTASWIYWAYNIGKATTKEIEDAETYEQYIINS